MAAAGLLGFTRNSRSPWRYHLRGGYDELLAIELHDGDCQLVARAIEAATIFLEVRGAMREGQAGAEPYNLPLLV